MAECPPLDDGTTIRMQTVATAIGVSRSLLSKLTQFNRRNKGVTNTTVVEGLCRFFANHHPNFTVDQLFEFDPPLGEGPVSWMHIDEAYPERAERSGREPSHSADWDELPERQQGGI